jgi:hypothetical protein
MPDNLTIRDGNGNATLVRTTEVAGVHVPHHVPAGYDAQDDMLKVKSIQKKWKDAFTTALKQSMGHCALGRYHRDIFGVACYPLCREPTLGPLPNC